MADEQSLLKQPDAQEALAEVDHNMGVSLQEIFARRDNMLARWKDRIEQYLGAQGQSSDYQNLASRGDAIRHVLGYNAIFRAAILDEFATLLDSIPQRYNVMRAAMQEAIDARVDTMEVDEFLDVVKNHATLVLEGKYDHEDDFKEEAIAVLEFMVALQSGEEMAQGYFDDLKELDASTIARIILDPAGMLTAIEGKYLPQLPSPEELATEQANQRARTVSGEKGSTNLPRLSTIPGSANKVMIDGKRIMEFQGGDMAVARQIAALQALLEASASNQIDSTTLYLRIAGFSAEAIAQMSNEEILREKHMIEPTAAGILTMLRKALNQVGEYYAIIDTAVPAKNRNASGSRKTYYILSIGNADAVPVAVVEAGPKEQSGGNKAATTTPPSNERPQKPSNQIMRVRAPLGNGSVEFEATEEQEKIVTLVLEFLVMLSTAQNRDEKEICADMLAQAILKDTSRASVELIINTIEYFVKPLLQKQAPDWKINNRTVEVNGLVTAFPPEQYHDSKTVLYTITKSGSKDHK